MLTWPELIALERTLRDDEVLTVYLDGQVDDHTERRAWHVRLHQALRDLRTWLADSPDDERQRFERCVQHLESELSVVNGALGAPGWCAFVTPDRVHHAGALPVPVPTLTVWASGVSVAPYVRALKQHRPVLVALADAKHVALYRYQGGVLEELEGVRSRAPGEHGRRMGAPPAQGMHTGVRGGTGHDEGQREQADLTGKMLKSAARRLSRLAGLDGWVVAGGLPIPAGRLIEALPRRLAARTMRLESLDVHAAEPDIRRAAEDAASALRNATDLDRVEKIAVLASKGGRAAIGAADTRAALDQGRVRELYVTHRNLLDHPSETESAVRAALDQDAVVEEVSGTAAERLDALGGYAARLHSPLTKTPEAPVEEAVEGPGAPPTIASRRPARRKALAASR